MDAFNPTQFKIDLILSEANLLISSLSNLTTQANGTKVVADELKVLLDDYKAKDCNCDSQNFQGAQLTQCKTACGAIDFGNSMIQKAYDNMNDALDTINASDFLEIGEKIGDVFDQDCLITNRIHSRC